MIDPLQQQCHDGLKVLLEQQIEGLQALDASLTSIKTAIAENDLDGLNQYLTRGNLPGPGMADFDSKRCELLSRYHYTTDLEGLKHCIKWCDQDEFLAGLYQRFEQHLDKLQKSIQVNSLLVNKGQDRVRRSLELLTGQANKDNSKTYSSNGRTDLEASLRSIAHA